MNGQLELHVEEDLGFEFADRLASEQISDRRGMAATRQLTGQERRSQQARYSRRPQPTRSSGAHRRRGKRQGV